MNLQEILRRKGSQVHSISPDATLDDVVQKLVDCNCGSLVVSEQPSDGRGRSRLIGIVTERDILRACASRRGSLDQIKVRDAMSQDLITGSPNDSIEDTMGLMTERRIRHLPILVDDQLAGLISIGDVVKAHHDEVAMENHYLKSYIQS
ncbi:MAG TPA: CBS domain-containing protein [Pirellulales bacterium]|jgi:CBS domain-containing protein|nr:CBS domain-containing protein [Pirellulales bacterium]